jgi:hypothetical protein
MRRGMTGIEKFRIPAIHYRQLVEALQAEGTDFNDEAKEFAPWNWFLALRWNLTLIRVKP